MAVFIRLLVIELVPRCAKFPFVSVKYLGKFVVLLMNLMNRCVDFR